MLILGIFSNGRVNAGYNLLMEFMPTQYQTLVSTLWLIGEACINLNATIIVWFITKDTDLLLFIGLFFSVISTLLQVLLPESPKWLYSKKRYLETYHVLHQMAKINKVQTLLPFT